VSFQFGSVWEKVDLFPSPFDFGLTLELNILTSSFFHPFPPLLVAMKMGFDGIVGKLIARAVDSGYGVQ